MKKLTPNQQAWENQVKRLQKLINKETKKGSIFLDKVIPERPERITKKKIELISLIKPTDIKAKAYTVDKETGELKQHQQAIKNKKNKVGAGISQPPKVNARFKKDKPAPKDRSESAKRSAETRKRKEQADPEYAEKMRKIRSEANKKMRDMVNKRKEQDPEYAEKLKQKRKEASKKAAETRKQRELNDPEYAEKRRKAREKANEKAKETRQKRKDEEEKRKQKEQQEYNDSHPPEPELEPEPEPEPETPKKEDKNPLDDYSDSWDEPDDYDDGMPDKTTDNIMGLMSLIDSAENPESAEFLREQLYNMIMEKGKDETAQTISYHFENTYHFVEGVCFSSTSDDIKQYGYSFLDIIYDRRVPSELLKQLAIAAETDRPSRSDYSSMIRRALGIR